MRVISLIEDSQIIQRTLNALRAVGAGTRRARSVRAGPEWPANAIVPAAATSDVVEDSNAMLTKR